MRRARLTTTTRRCLGQARSAPRLRGLTLIEIAVALGLFTVVGVTMLGIFLSNVQLARASEEEANTTAALRTELARVHQLELEGSGGHTGLDAVIWHYLRTPNFGIQRTTPLDAQPASGSVEVQTDLDDDGVYETLLDPDADGLGASETTSGFALPYDAARLRYSVNSVRIVFQARFRSGGGGETARLHALVLTRKEGQE